MPANLMPRDALLPAGRWVMLVAEWTARAKPSDDAICARVRSVGADAAPVVDPLQSRTWGMAALGALVAGVPGALLGTTNTIRESVVIVSVRGDGKTVSAGAVVDSVADLQPDPPGAIVFDPDSDTWDFLSGRAQSADRLSRAMGWVGDSLGWLLLAAAAAVLTVWAVTRR